MPIINCSFCGNERTILNYHAQKYTYHFCDKHCHANWKSKNACKENHPNYRGGFEAFCNNCGKPTWVKPSLAHKKEHFCGKTCADIWKSQNVRGDKASNWKGGDVSKICEYCNKSFTVKRGLATRGEGKYCSKECSVKSRYKKQKKICSQCRKPYLAKQCNIDKTKFCSIRCKNLSQIKERTKEWFSLMRINARMSALIRASIKENKNGRSWECLVGYTLHDLKMHLEKQFQNGMAWDNIGKWHIDHIIPRSYFAYSTAEDEQFKKCWALTNLQPLWAIDNLRKGNKILNNKNGGI